MNDMYHKSPLKWAGGKYKVLPHILPHIGNPKRYCEPFGGGLSVALNVDAEDYFVNDINKDLYCLYTNVDESFITECSELFSEENNTREKYLQFRDTFNAETDCRERAKLFLYLNKHCFNGLSRYNSKGKFNVPYGRENKDSKTGEIRRSKAHFPEKELREFIDIFSSKNVTFFNTSFCDDSLYQSLESGDVVYFDPPYVPLTDTANFTDYATEGFKHEQQVQLVEIAKSLSQRGIKVVISNHDVPITQELYKDAIIHSIQVTRSVSAKGGSRGKVGEIIAIY
jgi:DNA adenine methylase